MALKERIGTVVSDKMDKTVVVAVINRYPHPTYKKIVSRTTRYKAHDPENTCVLGDRVKIRETRPLSAHKRWAIEEILKEKKLNDGLEATLKEVINEVKSSMLATV